MPFRDRADAGRQLAHHLQQLHLTEVVVLALPHGGVPVAFEVAQALQAPLDVVVVRALRAPGQDVAFGAVAEGGVGSLLPTIEASADAIEALAERELAKIARDVGRLRGAWPPYAVGDKVAVVVDDAARTGNRVRAAALALRAREPRHILLALPAAPLATLHALDDDVDGIVCLEPTPSARALDDVYGDSKPVSARRAAALLERAQQWTPKSAEPSLSA